MKKTKKIMPKKIPMSIEQFIELSKERSANPEEVKAFRLRCAAREKVFAEEARKRRPTQECMNRQYTI